MNSVGLMADLIHGAVWGFEGTHTMHASVLPLPLICSHVRPCVSSQSVLCAALVMIKARRQLCAQQTGQGQQPCLRQAH